MASENKVVAASIASTRCVEFIVVPLLVAQPPFPSSRHDRVCS
jgi:hypothetical protein